MSGRVIWITGLSGAGKTTLAKAVLPRLEGSILLDGDALRNVLGAENTAFDYAGRQKLAFVYARLTHMLAMQGHTVIVATISLFHAVHAWNREHQPHYLEIFLDIPQDIRRQRDPKGLYAAEHASVIQNMAGIQTAVELPLHADIYFSEKARLEDMVATVVAHVQRSGADAHHTMNDSMGA